MKNLKIILTDDWGYFIEKGFRWYYMGNVEVPDNIERELDDIINFCLDDKEEVIWAMDQSDETTKILLSYIKSQQNK